MAFSSSPRELELGKEQAARVRFAALVCGVGRDHIPASILSKPGRLSAVEFEKMKIHPVVGAEILEKVEFPYPVAPIVRSHHEKWDGSGYPAVEINGENRPLRGEEIPLCARIVALADVYDALTSKRPKNTMTVARVHELAARAGFEVRAMLPLSRLFSGHRYLVLERT